MAIAAQLFVGGRQHERAAVDLDGTLRDNSWRPIDVEVADLSASGFRAHTLVALKIGDRVSIGISGLGVCGAHVVRVKPGLVACRFARDLPADYLTLIKPSHAGTIVPSALPSLASVQPDHPPATLPARFSPSSRVAIIIGLALTGWAAIAAAAFAIF